MKKLILFALLLSACNSPQKVQKEEMEQKTITISKERLKDKIKGAWAAQTIGVTFGLPAEFEYNTTMIQDYQELLWSDTALLDEFKNRPGTYDDIYMDLSFMKVIEEEGVDAPAQSFAESFAKADYELWFANQTARYNILNGLTPPESGHWINNPCADDIDFQIEADFAGLMSPGMVNSAVEICDKVGHIMNYGDGYYGGVFVASMYSLALISDDVSEIESIVERALRVIPEGSKFFQCINDVLAWYREDPNDWQLTWFKTSRKWGMDIGSPLGVFQPFNIDAKINSAWVVIGLLYGKGDYTRTFEIATRCGDDADCNPATAGGILAAIQGFKSIPEYWTRGLEKVESMPFMGTTISLIDAYDMSYRHAEMMILKNGGEISGESLQIKYQNPATIPLEVSFEGHYPIKKIRPIMVGNELSFEFEGKGFAIAAPADGKNFKNKSHIFEAQMYINGELTETAKLPTEINKRRFTPFYRYNLPVGRHKVVIRILNPVDFAKFEYNHIIIYGDKPYNVNLIKEL